MRRYAFLGLFFIPFVLFGFQKKEIPEGFKYYQDFKPTESQIFKKGHGRISRIQYADIREEGMISSWKKPNWELMPGGIRAIGSRVVEGQQREKDILEEYHGAETISTMHGWRTPWLTLSMGDVDWKDYSVETTVKPSAALTGGEFTTAGLAFRYQTPRHFYAFMLQKNQEAGLYYRPFDREATREAEAWIKLGSVPLEVVPGRSYRVKVQVEGQDIRCSVDGKEVIRGRDARIGSGRVALLADNPAEFGPVSVEGTLERKSEPPLPACARPKLVQEINLGPTKSDDRSLYFYDVDTDKELEIIITERMKDNSSYRCIEFDGKELWRVDGIKYPLGENSSDEPVCVFDINGDGKNEVVMAADLKLQVREGRTGRLLMSTDAPKPNQYLGDKTYRYERQLGEYIRPVRLSKADPPGFYFKDKYTNIWVYDHKLQLKWHRAMNTGHRPTAIDFNNDGRNEILASFTFMDAADGSTLWQLPNLSDHLDNTLYQSLDPGKKPKRLYLAFGENGLLEVEAETGKILYRGQLGHIQLVNIADFVPETPGLELLTQTRWREDRVHYLMDKDLNILAIWLGTYGNTYDLPWGEGGRMLPMTPDGIVDPMTGRVIVPRFGSVETVIQDPRWKQKIVVTEDGDVLKLFGPEM